MAERHYHYRGMAIIESDQKRNYHYLGMAFLETLVTAAGVIRGRSNKRQSTNRPGILTRAQRGLISHRRGYLR